MAGTDQKTADQAAMLTNRLQKRHRHLRKWAKRVGTDAYRLYDRDIPEIPLLLDIYGDSLSGALYERPYEKDAQEEDRWLQAMTEAIQSALEIPAERQFIKQRRHLRNRQTGEVQYSKQADRGFFREIREGNLIFRVNLSDYLDTGLFLDHRKTRSLVRDQSRGKRVLNLFCYTASFSIYAASGDALSVDSVDLSNTYLDWALENFTLNGLGTVKISAEDFFQKESLPSPYRLIRSDALRFISEARNRAFRWDLIILDPPTFSNSKKMKGTLDVRRDYQDMIQTCLSILNPGGILWFSTNARGFKIEASDFPRSVITDMKLSTTDEDFKDKLRRSCYTITL